MATAVMTQAAAVTRPPKTNETVETLWRQYHETGDTRVRDRLVLSLSPLVKYIVFKKIREVPGHFEADDFISCGLIALLGAIDRWEPSKGATLEQFAWTRIHGAVLDELRSHDWAPRSLRRWQRDMGRARDNFSALYDRRPTTMELADTMGITVKQLHAKLDDLARAEIESLNVDVLGDGENPIQRIDTIHSDDDETDPEAAYARGEGLERFRKAFDRLSERDRLIVALMYREDFTLREIGQFLGLTESRICQIHGQIKKRLAAELSSQAELFV
ncbi:MAG: sigma-70 family RNA polymerase sigma factor [Solirubrobacteraceae bacterium]